MIPCIIILLIGLGYLGHVTKWGRIRLLVGIATPPVYPSSPWYLGRWIDGFSINTDSYCFRTITETPPNTNGYYFELDAYGIRNKMLVRDTAVIGKVMKALKPSKAERKAFA